MENNSLLSAFTKSSQKKWDAYLSAMDDIEGRLTMKADGLLENGDWKTVSGDCFVAMSFPMWCEEDGICTYEEDPRFGTYTVSCSGNDYVFELTKRTPDGPWAIRDLVDLENTLSKGDLVYAHVLQEQDAVWRRQLYRPKSLLLVGVQLYPCTDLPFLMTLPEFKITRSEEVTENGQDYLRLDFQCEFSQERFEELRILVSSGWVMLIPDHWLIHRAAFRTRFGPSDPGTWLEISREYDFDAYGVPLPTRGTQRAFEKAGASPTYIHETAYALRPISDRSAERFTLSHYGLPEPDSDDHDPDSQDEVLDIAPRSMEMGERDAGEDVTVTFWMTNLASETISVVGERSSCCCAFSDSTPVELPPHIRTPVKVKVRLPVYQPEYSQVFTFMVAEPRRLAFYPVTLTATIRNPLEVPRDEEEPPRRK